MASRLTEDSVQRLALDDKAMHAARDLVRKRSLRELGASADGTCLLGWCQGSADYEVSERAAKHRKTACERASSGFEPAPTAFRQQLRDPLSPREATDFLRCKTIGPVGDRAAIEDDSGTRIEVRDRGPAEPNVANLLRVAVMLASPAVLALLRVVPIKNAIVAQPLAALNPEIHLRLGLRRNCPVQAQAPQVLSGKGSAGGVASNSWTDSREGRTLDASRRGLVAPALLAARFFRRSPG